MEGRARRATFCEQLLDGNSFTDTITRVRSASIAVTSQWNGSLDVEALLLRQESLIQALRAEMQATRMQLESSQTELKSLQHIRTEMESARDVMKTELQLRNTTIKELEEQICQDKETIHQLKSKKSNLFGFSTVRQVSNYFRVC